MKRQWVLDERSQKWVPAPGGVQPDSGNPLARWLASVAKWVADRERRRPAFRVARFRSVWQEFPNPTGRYWIPFTADRWVTWTNFYVFERRVLTITRWRPFRGPNINAIDSAGWTGRRH